MNTEPIKNELLLLEEKLFNMVESGHMTVKEFCEKVDIKHPIYSRWKNWTLTAGKYDPVSYEQIISMCKVFKISNDKIEKLFKDLEIEIYNSLWPSGGMSLDTAWKHFESRQGIGSFPAEKIGRNWLARWKAGTLNSPVRYKKLISLAERL